MSVSASFMSVSASFMSVSASFMSVSASFMSVSASFVSLKSNIATCSGHVFVFDVLENRDLTHAGRLRHVLEDNNVLKIGHLTIERHRGRRLPAGLPVSELCLQYADASNRMYMYDWRTQAKKTWMSMVGNFWAMRPLTPDMVEFAACDVIVLIPDVYRRQSDYIDKHGLRKAFKIEVEDWLLIDIDDVIREKHGRRVIREVTSVLQAIHRKYDDRASVFNILEEDEIHALALTTYEDAAQVSERVRHLKKAYILKELDDVELKLRTETESWEDKGNMLEYLRYHQQLTDKDISNRANQIFQQTLHAILEHVEEKYGEESSTNMLTLAERDGLLTLPYKDIAEGRCGSVTSGLYWRLMEEEIHGMINCLRFSPNQFTLTEDEYAKIAYFTTDACGSVPESVVALATGLVHSLRAFNAATGGYTIDKRRCKSAI
ncbi:hypothetical protein MAR_019620 [Mya arenaria]|uniref:Uncharacterized protein n=1 Tax=Mya arenaria TaxID=6604 RepID=A0ABY7E5L8_MYAAR|nr:hypothetical protein MAR_019620 [Mya arenaria]